MALITKIMFTIKFYAIVGLCYIIIGVTNYKAEWLDKLCEELWGFGPSAGIRMIRLGISFIIMEIILDFIINSFV